MFYRLFQSCRSFLVVPILINLHIGTSLEETRKILESLRFLVEHYDIFHVLRILMPISSLQEVCCKNKSFRASGSIGKGNNFVWISQFNQALQ